MPGAFGEELRRLRGTMTLRALAQLSHFSSSHISNVENGTKPPTEAFARACDAALATDGALTALVQVTTKRAAHGRSPRPAQLPPSPELIGRNAVLRALDDQLHHRRHLTSATVMALDGQAGVGKTSLALGWAHEVKHLFPDGAFFADLHGFSPDEEPVDATDVLENVLKALGVPPDAMPATAESRSALLRTRLADTRTLLVLDNASHADQVRPLIPAAPGCLVLVTSRQRLAALAVRHGAFCVTIDPFDRADALALLRDVVGGTRVDAEPEAAEQIVELCGGLPLAVRIAAERIASSRHLTLTGLAEELSDVDQRLDVLSSDDDVDAAVRAVFSWSFRALDADAARLFRLLSLHPGREFGVACPTVLSPGQPSKTARLLNMLARGHLLQEVGPHRFRFHDLLRDYATEQVEATESVEEIAAARRHLLEWYLQAATAASHAMSPDRPFAQLKSVDTGHAPPHFATPGDAVMWCETELTNLAAATWQATALELNTVAVGLPLVLTDYLYWRNPWSTWLVPLKASLNQARRQGNVTAQAFLLSNLANGYIDQRRFEEAMQCVTEALEICQRLKNPQGRLWSHVGIGRVLQAHEEHDEAVEHYRWALDLAGEIGERWSWAVVNSYLSDAYRALGKYDVALDGFDKSVTVLRELGDRQAESCALDRIGEVHRNMGNLRSTVAYLEEALAASESVVDLWGRAALLRKLGDVQHELGEDDDARRAWKEAVQMFEDLGDARARGIRARLAALHNGPVPAPRPEPQP
ncbi:tetratricopeptide repeat protein [Actinosynnema sp. NPDC050436]|uniref:tetratricopeptide repeat protein n=1 Tax=Actinosynnema sp. NPDC050436 TaxID=3155659 RepID=UPI0033CA06A2